MISKAFNGRNLNPYILFLIRSINFNLLKFKSMKIEVELRTLLALLK